jgi:hypothetical protein
MKQVPWATKQGMANETRQELKRQNWPAANPKNTTEFFSNVTTACTTHMHRASCTETAHMLKQKSVNGYTRNTGTTIFRHYPTILTANSLTKIDGRVCGENEWSVRGPICKSFANAFGAVRNCKPAYFNISPFHSPPSHRSGRKRCWYD